MGVFPHLSRTSPAAVIRVLRLSAMNTDTYPRDHRAASPDDAAPQATSTPPHKAPYAGLVAGTPVRDVDLEIRGAHVHLRAYGDADAPLRVLFLHGLRGDHHGLEPIVAHILQRRPDLQVFVPDLPGFGASAPLPDGLHDVAAYAAWTAELLAVVAPDGDVVLAGHSLGSIVGSAAVAALETAGGPEGAPRVRALVLVNPVATAALAGPQRLLSSVSLGVQVHRLAAALPERVGTAMLRHPLFTRVVSVAMVTTRDRALRRWIHAEHGRYFAGFANRRTLLEAFHTSSVSDVATYAPQISVPTLLIAAENDGIVPLPSQRELAVIFARARLVVVPEVGHLAHYEAPDLVARETVEFFAALGEPSLQAEK
jgi:pimeloyl-ACP methyl ester carboxylesterase